MRNITLRQLHTFVEVAQQLSFTRAARRLHLTQPAVSMQVRQLQQAAGLALFTQTGKRIALTEAGRELLRYANGVIELLREAEGAMRALEGTTGGELSLAVTSTAKYFAPRLLAEFRREHPLVKVRLVVSNREAVIRELEANAVDLAVMGRSPRGLDTVAVAFAKHPLAIIAMPGHPLAGRRRIPLAKLASAPFLIRERGSGTRNSMERLFGAHHFRPAETMEMNSNETIKQAVMAGMGISFLSLHTVGLEMAARRLIVLSVTGTPVTREWFAIHRTARRLSPAAAAFKAFLVERGAAMIERVLGEAPIVP